MKRSLKKGDVLFMKQKIKYIIALSFFMIHLFNSNIVTKCGNLIFRVGRNIKNDPAFQAHLLDSLIDGFINKKYLLYDIQKILIAIHDKLLFEKHFTRKEKIDMALSLTRQIAKLLLLGLDVDNFTGNSFDLTRGALQFCQRFNQSAKSDDIRKIMLLLNNILYITAKRQYLKMLKAKEYVIAAKLDALSQEEMPDDIGLMERISRIISFRNELEYLREQRFATLRSIQNACNPFATNIENPTHDNYQSDQSVGSMIFDAILSRYSESIEAFLEDNKRAATNITLDIGKSLAAAYCKSKLKNQSFHVGTTLQEINQKQCVQRTMYIVKGFTEDPAESQFKMNITEAFAFTIQLLTEIERISDQEQSEYQISEVRLLTETERISAQEQSKYQIAEVRTILQEENQSDQETKDIIFWEKVKRGSDSLSLCLAEGLSNSTKNEVLKDFFKGMTKILTSLFHNSIDERNKSRSTPSQRSFQVNTELLKLASKITIKTVSRKAGEAFDRIFCHFSPSSKYKNIAYTNRISLMNNIPDAVAMRERLAIVEGRVEERSLREQELMLP